MKGWIIDLYPSQKSGKMIVWLRTRNGCYKIKEDYSPKFYVESDKKRLDQIKKYYEDEGFKTNFVSRKTDIYSSSEKQLLSIDPGEVFDPRDQLEAVRFFDGYDRYQFYNVDIPLDQRYLIEKGIKPFSLVKKEAGWKNLEEEDSIYYSKPNLKSVSLEIETKGDKDEKTAELEHVKIEKKKLGGREKKILKALNRILEREDPDVILTSGGDQFSISYLARRAEVNDVRLQLGREKGMHPPKNGSWFESYGRVIYKPPSYPLKGRIHIDTENSFLYKEGGLDGLIEASRLSKIPIQRLSRRSPGSLINAMETEQALKEGYLIPWKKNFSEDFKKAKELIKSDRGGHIFEPKVGFHKNVLKLDYASMYPSIIDKYNLSPETLNCDCEDYNIEHHQVPETGYDVCEKNRGILPKVVEPLIERRQKYKELKDKNDFFERRADVLKWLLVTCFGYTGYKKARFNCIEVHESITAYGRDILLIAAESAEKMGFEVIHGIVDSLWLKGDERKVPSLLKRVKNKTRLELENEGKYRWIVFVQSKAEDVGALNHYFGVFEGEPEVKGLYAKRSDTPEFFKEVQMEIIKELTDLKEKKDIENRMNKIIGFLKEKWNAINNRDVNLEKLFFIRKASKKAEEYDHMTEMKSALVQYKKNGLNKLPGQEVEYIVKNSKSRDAYEKVKIKNEKPQLYDTDYYNDYLIRVAEEVLSPFGYDGEDIRRKIKKV